MNSTLKTFEAFMDEALLKSLSEFALTPSTAPQAATEVLKTRLCFEGAGMKAQAFILCTRPFLEATCPLPRGTTEHSQIVLKDWLGELGNLILGRLKNRLLAHDITIKISAPSFEGNWQKPATAQSLVTWFQLKVGVIGFDCTIEGTVPEIGEAVKQTAEILPGDAIYRLNDPFNTKSSYDIISKIRSGIQQGNDLEDGEEDEIEYMEEQSDAENDNEFDADQGEIAAAEERAKRENSRKGRPRVNKAKTYDADAEPSTKSVPKPIRILFHSQPQTPVLTSLAWTQIDKLVLHFSSGLQYSICPRTLLEQGASTFEVEGIIMTFQRDGDLIRTSIPKYNMHMSKSSRVA